MTHPGFTGGFLVVVAGPMFSGKKREKSMKLPELNRHTVGIPAILMLLVALGFVSNFEFGNRQVASLTQDETTQAGPSLTNIPPNAYGFAGVAEHLKEQAKAIIEAETDHQ